MGKHFLSGKSASYIEKAYHKNDRSSTGAAQQISTRNSRIYFYLLSLVELFRSSKDKMCIFSDRQKTPFMCRKKIYTQLKAIFDSLTCADFKQVTVG
jgi:predicted DNA-binding protein YlxM (UPF0122 family)